MSGSSAAQPVKTLFVTLMRGYAGKPWFHRKALEALGLKTRHQCVEVPNSPNVRGRLLKVCPRALLLHHAQLETIPDAPRLWIFCFHLTCVDVLARLPPPIYVPRRHCTALLLRLAAAPGLLKAMLHCTNLFSSCSAVQVPHLVRVETDAMFLKRKTAQAQADALRPPLRFQHAPAAPAAARQARQ